MIRLRHTQDIFSWWLVIALFIVIFWPVIFVGK
jgi:hypothetical protein